MSATLQPLYRCGISGCTQTLKTFSAILSHIGRKHRNCDFTDLEPVDTAPQQEPLVSEPDTDELGTSSSALAQCNAVSSAQRSTALLILNMKERHRLTQSAVSFTIGQIKQILAHTLDDVKASIKHRICEVDIDDCFNVNPFEGLNTEYFQTKFYQDHFNLIVSPYSIVVPMTEVVGRCICQIIENLSVPFDPPTHYVAFVLRNQ